MKKSDEERLKKIISTWESLSRQMKERNITKEDLLNDEFYNGQLPRRCII